MFSVMYLDGRSDLVVSHALPAFYGQTDTPSHRAVAHNRKYYCSSLWCDHTGRVILSCDLQPNSNVIVTVLATDSLHVW